MDDCNCLCETMEWCVEKDCRCHLNDALYASDLLRVGKYLDENSKYENRDFRKSSPGWMVYEYISIYKYDCSLLLCDFIQLIEGFSEEDLQNIDSEIIQKEQLRYETRDMYDKIRWGDPAELNREHWWSRLTSLSADLDNMRDEIRMLERIQTGYEMWKDTEAWKIYLIFKEYKLESEF